MSYSGKFVACLAAASLAAMSCTAIETDEQGEDPADESVVDDQTSDDDAATDDRGDATSSTSGAPASDDEAAVTDTSVSTELVRLLAETAQPNEAAGVFVPLQMHYLERYFEGATNPSSADLAIAAILDESPGAAAVFERALSTYRAMSLEDKHALFDPEMVDLTADTAVAIDLERVYDRLGSIVTPAELGDVDAPVAPSDLVARNTSLYQGIGGDSDAPPTYRITLQWNDNSGDEAGFNIYRSMPTMVEPALVATVDADVTMYDDVLLGLPDDPDELGVALSWCYQVKAFTEAPFTLAGQEPVVVESEGTPLACSDFWPPPDDIDRSDVDGDGFIGEFDLCPSVAGFENTTQGCPDEDRDGISDVMDRNGVQDQCTVRTDRDDAWGDQWSDASGVNPPDGCPYRFAVSWMGMEVTSNSAEYLYPLVDVGNAASDLPSILYMNEVDEFPGEEPWLTFSWANGLASTGATAHGSSEWCCGEGIDVASGDVWEPDGTVLAEAEGADLAADAEILDHGLVVIPTQSINRVGGMELTIALLERDWTATVRESQEADIGDMLEVGLTIVEIGSCVYAPTLSCLVDAAEVVVDIIESIFGMADVWVEVDDPDDWMGDGVWGISRNEALHRTSTTGAYGFWVEIPWQRNVVCISGFEPCPESEKIPSGLIANVYLCLHREGLATEQITTACGPFSSYERVLPWPMELGGS